MITSAQPIVSLWPAQAVPDALGTVESDTPTLTLFRPRNASAVTFRSFVCPVGGYLRGIGRRVAAGLNPLVGSVAPTFRQPLGLSILVISLRPDPAGNSPPG